MYPDETAQEGDCSIKNILTKKRFIEISRIERKLHSVSVLKKI